MVSCGGVGIDGVFVPYELISTILYNMTASTYKQE